MTNWYAADTPFGDPGTLMFLGRPFGSTHNMDSAMLEVA